MSTEETLSETPVEIDIEPKVLIVDDDEGIRKLLTVFFDSRGFDPTVACDGQEALEMLEDDLFDVIVTDMIMPRKTGMELLNEVRNNFPSIPVIIITGKPAVDAAVECMQNGAFDYISKPIDFAKLQERVTLAIEQHRELMDEADATQSFVNINHRRFFGHYRILRILGEGNVGIVFLAQPTEDAEDSLYALKVLKPRATPNEDLGTLPERFLNEAEAAATVRHPNVIEIAEYGVTEDESIPYIVMEYFEGESLKQHVINHFLLDHRQKAQILRQLAGAIAAIHERDVTHRDIKPHNVLVNDRLQIKLTDFGIAKLPQSELTLTTELLGSPAYLSPEAFESSRVDCRADIFSLGVVCYELYTGQKPFLADSIPRFARLIQSEKPIEPRKIDPNLPLFLQQMVARMLRKDPADRYQTAAEIVSDFDSWLNGEANGSGLGNAISKCLRRDWK